MSEAPAPEPRRGAQAVAPAESGGSAGRNLARAWLAKGMMEIVLLALCVGLALRAPNFFTPDNLLTVLRSISMQGIIAFGMTLVIIVGEIDLSVGATVAFAGCLIAVLAERGVPIPIGIALTLAAGGAQGVFTGVMRARFAIPTFITTLALFTGLRGAALMLTNGFPITPFPEWYFHLGGGYLLGAPIPALILLAVFLALHVTMTRTAFGRAVYATGGNPEAARLAGINVARVRVQALALTSALAALSGILLSARIMSGSPKVAEGWELDIISAVIIGGTSLSGGIGTIRGTLVGIVFIGVVVNGMTLLDIPVFTQYVVRGLLIFAAVFIGRIQPPQRGAS